MAAPTTHQAAEEVRALVEELFAGLDHLPYYAFLGITPGATPGHIQEAFYRRAEKLHPDRFFNLSDLELRNQIYEVYKRVAEAYRVLESPAARKEYDEGLARGQFRLIRQEREGLNLKQPDEGIESPQAKRFFRLGLDALHAKDLKGAHMNFTFALSMEPGNAVIKAQVADLEAKLGLKKRPG
ncbi:MAG: J domain-containing protein [Deltaproteobacteria bacterium]|nr:J domain-containing protein [Deltaproteobacteria bacterium]